MQYPIMLGGGDQHRIRRGRVQEPLGAAATRLDHLPLTNCRAHNAL
jgi:hypothetical protein